MRCIARVSVVSAPAVLLASCSGGADEAAPESGESPLAVEEIAPGPEAAPTAAAPETPDVAPSASPPAEPAPAPAPAASPVAAVAAPPAAFMQCRACHSVNPGQHGIGPSLAGVFGTKAGDIPGYRFSDAMLKSGLVWDEATLDRFLQAPARTVPGTKMVYAGMQDAAKRREVVAYIKSLK